MTGKKTILIVEDNPTLKKILTEKFDREGFTVLEAGDGEEAFNIAVKEAPDLILLDLALPILDGMSMLKKLRSYNTWGLAVPVIITTNSPSSAPGRLQEINDTSPAYYIDKSQSDINEIVEKVNQILSD